jgi:hypothetical protein
MGVGLGDFTVGGPAGVAHADVSAEGIRLQGTDQIGQFAHAAAQGEATILKHSYSSRIVTTVFQTLKALNDDRRRLSRAHVTDNSTHFVSLLCFWLMADNQWLMAHQPKRSLFYLP